MYNEKRNSSYMKQTSLLHINLRNAIIGCNAVVSYLSHLSLITVSDSSIHTIINMEMLLDNCAIMKMKASYVNQTSPLHIALWNKIVNTVANRQQMYNEKEILPM